MTVSPEGMFLFLGVAGSLMAVLRVLPRLGLFILLTAVVGGLMLIGERWFGMEPGLFLPLSAIVFVVVLALLRFILWIYEGPGSR